MPPMMPVGHRTDNGSPLSYSIGKRASATMEKKRGLCTAGEGNDRLAILAPDGTNRRILQLQGVLKTHWIEDPEWY